MTETDNSNQEKPLREGNNSVPEQESSNNYTPSRDWTRLILVFVFAFVALVVWYTLKLFIGD